MLGHLIRKEILTHLTDLRFLILAGLGATVIWLGLYSGCADYLERLSDYRDARALTEDRIRQVMEVEDWRELIGAGYPEHKAPTPLSIVSRGLDPTLGRTAQVRGRGVRIKRSPVSTDLILGVFPPLDLGLIVEVVLSLFVLLLTYDAISGEKEGGTLRLVASFPVSRAGLLLSKFAAALIPILIVFGLPVILGLAVLSLHPDIQLTGLHWGRLSWIVLAFVLYLATFICAGLLASCLTRRSATSFVLLLTFWASVVLVLPRLGLIVADGVHPAPSFYHLQAEKDAIDARVYQEQRARSEEWGAGYKEKHGDDWWQSPDGREAFTLFSNEQRLERYELVWEEQGRLIEAYQNAYRVRTRLAGTLARFSPAFALKNSLIRLAGTGLDRQQRFEDALDGHWRRQRLWYAKVRTRDGLRWAKPDQYGAYQWDVSDLPRFSFQNPWPEEEIQTSLTDFGVLGIWAVLLFLGGYVAFLRYDFR